MSYDNREKLNLSILCKHLGAEITDLDVRNIGDEVSLDAIRAALHKHQLLCFREQQLSPDELVNFTCLFGEMLPHVLQQFSLPENPDIYVLSNIVENGEPLGNRREGFGWHTDLTYMEVPPSYTILYGLEVPSEGGDTLYASLYQAWDALKEEEKDRLRGIRTVHSYPHLYSKRVNVEPLTEDQKDQTPDVVQPAVRIHPDTGREGMYINTGDCIGVEGVSLEESNNILEFINELYDFTINNYSYRHKWKVRDLLIWDNRGLLHTATDYDLDLHRRLIWRTSVVGERPIPWRKDV